MSLGRILLKDDSYLEALDGHPMLDLQVRKNKGLRVHSRPSKSAIFDKDRANI